MLWHTRQKIILALGVIMREIRFTVQIALLLFIVGLSGVEIGLIAESLPGLGNIACFAMYGDYAIFGGGQHNLQVLDMRDPENMEIVGWLDFTEIGYMTSSSITIDGEKAYLNYLENCAIVSLADPFAPVLLSNIHLGNAMLSMAVAEDILYIGSMQGELTAYIRSFSVTDPLHPVLLDSLAIEIEPDEILSGDGVIVSNQYGGVPLVIRTNNPAELLSLGCWGLESVRVEVKGNLMVCINGTQAAVLDLHNLSNSPGTVLIEDWPDNCFIQGDRFWFTTHIFGGDTRLIAIDISDLANPQICYNETLLINSDYSVMHSGNWLVTKRNWEKDILFADLEASPVTQFNYSFEMRGVGPLASKDGQMVGMTGSGQISLLNVHEDGKVDQQTVLRETFFGAMAVQDGLIFTAFPFRIYDASNTKLLSTLELEGEWSIERIVPAGQRVIVCAEGDGYHWYIIDISDPSQPTVAYRSDDDGHRWRTAVVEGDRLWIAGWGGLHCYDISNIGQPQLLYEDMLYTASNFLNPVRMIKRGDYLYMTNGHLLASLSLGESGVQEISTQEIPNHSYCVVPFGEGLVIGSTLKFTVMSLADPLHPQEIAWRWADTSADYAFWDCVAVRDNLIFVGTGKKLLTFDGELARLLLSNPEPVTEQKLQVYPNPAVDATNVVCKLNRAGKIKLELYNLRGQLVKHVSRDNAAEDFNLMQLELKDDRGKRIASGVYLIHLWGDGTQRTAKLVVKRSK